MATGVCYLCNMDRELDFEEATVIIPAVQKHTPKVPWHLPLIGGTAVLWSLLGVFDLLAILTQYAPYMSGLPETTRDFIYALPGWVLTLRAAAVFASLAGAVMLIRRQVMAVRVLAFGAGATILGMALSFIGGAPDDSAFLAVAVFIIVTSVLLVYYAQTWAKRGVLR